MVLVKINPFHDLLQHYYDINRKNLRKNTRNVFLPAGPDGADLIWKQDDGRYYAGGQWLNGTVVPLDRILYYERQAEGARPGDTISLGRR